jgi:asparagine synthase (glutamine-hydrolysing)
MIGLCDGMISWSYLINGVHVLDDLADHAHVTMEAAPQDTYMGHDLWQHEARALESTSVTDLLYDRYGKRSPKACRRLLNDRVDDPRASIAAEVDASPADAAANVFRDVVWRSLAYSHFRSSAVVRSQVGTRVPCASTDFLETAARRPADYNRRSVPFTGGRVPMATTRLKFELVRRLDDQLASVTYGLSGLPPSMPQWAHVVGMGVQECRHRLRRAPTNQPAMLADWYRDDPTLNSRLNALLDAAAERPAFNAGAVRTLQHEHVSGRENHVHEIAAITTAESWRQQYLD